MKLLLIKHKFRTKPQRGNKTFGYCDVYQRNEQDSEWVIFDLE